VSLGAIFFEVNAAEARVDNDFSPWKRDSGQIVEAMAEKSAKKKPKKPADASVLGSLPSSRPARLGGDRRAGAPRTRATKPKAAAKPPATATKPPAAKPKVAAKPKAAPTSAPPAGWQVPSEPDQRRDGGPAELVTTAVQAAGELAQIGLTVGGQILKRAAGRLPRP
jgi:hypothetical protein